MKSFEEIIAPIQQVNISRYILEDDGTYPNNPRCSLLIYHHAVEIPKHKAGKMIMEFLESNGWSNAWENGIYDYHHYHSITHEVLVIISGSVRVQFGGDNGIAQQLNAGDVVIIPAGVAHKNLSDESDFKCIGAYPDGRNYDVLTGNGDRPKADDNIKKLPTPETDPIFGADGTLLKNWKQ
jgi:uncharacterized protein YjlB